MTQDRTQQKGYSLVEVLVAVAILMLAIVAPMTIAVKSIQSAQYATQQMTAIFLAQEAMSMVFAMRESHALEILNQGSGDFWEWTKASSLAKCEGEFGCNFLTRTPLSMITTSDYIDACTPSGSNCQMYYDASLDRTKYGNHGQGVATPFTRRVFISDKDDTRFLVRVEVTWRSRFLNTEQTVLLESYVYNIYGAL